MEEINMWEQCGKCKKYKPLWSFCRRKTSKLGVNNRCKLCDSIYTKGRMKTEEVRLRNLEVVKRYQNKNRKLIRERWRAYYYKKYDLWVNFLKELGYNKCSICGYDECFASLDFHHDTERRNGNKSLSVGKLISCAFTEKRKLLLIEELKKCICVCANCHRKLHYEENIRRA